MLSSSSTRRRIEGSAIIRLASAHAALAAATSRARSCVSQVKPSPIVRHSAWAPKRSMAVRSPVDHAPLMNCTTPTPPQHESESCRRLAFARTGVDDEETFLKNWLGVDLRVLRGLALHHFGLVVVVFDAAHGTLSGEARAGRRLVSLRPLSHIGRSIELSPLHCGATSGGFGVSSHCSRRFALHLTTPPEAGT